MIKITLEFNSYAEAVAVLKLVGNVGLGDAVGVADAPNPLKAAAAGKPAAVKPTPAPAPAASSPAPTPSAAPADEYPKPEDLTKLVVAAVGRAGRDKVVAHLRGVYNVAKGAEITDLPTRIKAMASVAAL